MRSNDSFDADATVRSMMPGGSAAAAARPVGSKGRRRGNVPHRQTFLISIPIVSVTIMIMVGPVTAGKSPRELRILFHQQLRRAFRPNEDRVRVEPDVRIGL